MWVSSQTGLSAGCSRIGALTRSRSSGATRTWSSWAWVQTIALTVRPADDREDGVDVVRRVDDDALVVVTDHPDVVVDVEGLAVEGERAAGDGVVDTDAHRITTERSTSPECILSKAASTSPSAISSVTNASRSSRPCW